MANDNTISRKEGLWINDPETGRPDDPDELKAYFVNIERSNFESAMRNGKTPEEAWRDLETRKRYIAYLKEHKSPLANG